MIVKIRMKGTMQVYSYREVDHSYTTSNMLVLESETIVKKIPLDNIFDITEIFANNDIEEEPQEEMTDQEVQASIL